MVRENMAMKDFYKMFFRTGAKSTDKRELFDLLLKQLGIDGYTKEEVEKIKESTMDDGGYCKTQYLLQVSQLINDLSSANGKSMAAAIVQDWEHDPEAIVELRVAISIMRSDKFNPEIETVFDDLHRSTSRGANIVRDAAAIAFADNITFTGEEFLTEISS